MSRELYQLSYGPPLFTAGIGIMFVPDTNPEDTPRLPITFHPNAITKICQEDANKCGLLTPPSPVHLLIILPVIIYASRIGILVSHGFRIRNSSIFSFHFLYFSQRDLQLVNE